MVASKLSGELGGSLGPRSLDRSFPGGISWEVELCPSKLSNFKQPSRVLGGLGW